MANVTPADGRSIAEVVLSWPGEIAGAMAAACRRAFGALAVDMRAL